MDRAAAHVFIFLTILLGLYGQVVLKWQVNLAGQPPSDWPERAAYVLKMLFNPWVLSSLAAAFLGMLSWILALGRADLSYAYPFTSLAFVLVLLASAVLFREPITITKLVGMMLIVAGIIIGSR